eukprot:gene27033-32666_t
MLAFLVALAVLVALPSTLALSPSNRYAFSSSKLAFVRHGSVARAKGSGLWALGDKERRITRSDEGEYFESEFDRKPLKERLPVALGVLAGVSFPFLIGLIYLYSSK